MRHRFMLLLASLAVLLAACTTTADGPIATTSPNDSAAGGDTSTTTTAPSEQSYAGVDPAPEFPSGLDWLNVEAPVTLEQLRGKVVLLDFWTYGCINCIHIIPDLKRLETEYPNELVVIGVHSAKFLNEGSTDNIRQVILRYGLDHPVVNDHDFAVWNTWGATGWPTIVVIDPAGNIVGGFSGEGVYVRTEPVIASLVSEFEGKGLLDRTPFTTSPERQDLPSTVLAYPGKVLIDEVGDRLFIADTGHNRIVQANPDTGEVVAVFGSGRAGFTSGSALEARFNAPQGMALSPDGTVLYVADTGNHTVRLVDLSTGRVGVLVGTGQIGWPPTPGYAPDVPLNSPWDLVVRDQTVYIAMAGTHQIWSMDLASGAVGPIVGSSAEGTANGPTGTAELAQPSGLAFDAAGRLYFADSESSSIRWADVFADEPATGVLAGGDETLFDFGDVDGTGTEARFQHPLGVVVSPVDGTLIVADTYNSKLKKIDPTTGVTTTWLGGEQGWSDGDDPLFYEPGGLSIGSGSLYVADTNNNSIRVVDLVSGATRTLVLKGIETFNPAPDNAEYRGTIVRLDPVNVSAGDGAFRLAITLPDGHKVNPEAPSSVTWTSTGGVALFAADANTSLTGVSFPVDIPAEFVEGTGEVTADVTVIYCREVSESLCYIQQLRFLVPISVGPPGASSTVMLPYVVSLPGS